MSKVLHKYKNGNVDVTLLEDGTKIREWEGDQYVEFNESADLKVTQFCDLGDQYNPKTKEFVAKSKTCAFCHEQSNNIGKHGNLGLIEDIWASQQAGTELAIGGGNPLAHPHIDSFLYNMSRKGIIPNITMNMLHLKRFLKQIRDLQKEKCVYGMGVSYRGRDYLKNLPTTIDYTHVVFHMILGLNDYDDCKAVIDWCRENQVQPKLLLLGYKQFGNGIQHYSPELQGQIDAWQTIHLKRLMGVEGLTLSFDNLAIKQLELQSVMSKDQWDTFYLGDDGSHTNFVDSVTELFARSSTSTKRYPLSMVNNTREMMAIIHEEVKKDRLLQDTEQTNK